MISERTGKRINTGLFSDFFRVSSSFSDAAQRDGRDSYRIGYAEAHCREPHKWKRTDDQAGISLGPQEYDNCMQAYPYVFQVKNKKYLIYSGNGFGAEGICCAVWE